MRCFSSSPLIPSTPCSVGAAIASVGAGRRKYQAVDRERRNRLAPLRENLVDCVPVSSRSRGAGIVLGAVVAWVVVITALHVVVNSRGQAQRSTPFATPSRSSLGGSDTSPTGA